MPRSSQHAQREGRANVRYRAAEVERLIIALVTEDLSNQQIGQRLGLSPITIRNYLHRLFLRFDVQSRTGLVVAALKTGALTLDGVRREEAA
jgi:DNA-binding CsgD family transcriptional regulator